MILDNIILENFGIYAGQQAVDLVTEEPGKPIVLFGGMNGGGKTTFLDAVQLAFYGPKARCSNRGKLSYRDYLRSVVHRGVSPEEGASVTIHFRRVEDGEMHSYRLLRTWRESKRGLEEKVEVLRDGQADPLLSEGWDEYIESYIPSGISHLFFFDAEQIKELAEGEHAAELLGTAIHSLLGLDLVDRLETDLLTLERRKKTVAKTGESAERLKNAEEELARLDQMQEETTNEKARLSGELAELVKQVEDCEKRFKLEGGELFEQRADLECELARLQKDLADKENMLRDLAEDPAPFLLVAPLLDKTETQACCESEVRKSEVIASVLEERDERVLDELRQTEMPRDYLVRLKKILREDRDARRAMTFQPCYLDADDHLVSELRHLRAVVLPEVSRKIATLIETAGEIREVIVRVETRLARVPAADAIANLQRELEKLRVRCQGKQAEVDALETKLQLIVRQRAAGEEAVSRALEEEAEKQFDREDEHRILKHAAKVRGTLAQFRTAIIRKHAAHIEQLMLEAFRQLMRKSNLITALKIDPQTFRIELTGADGRPLPFDRLSAGERQLLATSLLWGLARASGRPIPTIIDTPLARLDSSHRRRLLERYFPATSHQVILLSTDEEIDENGLKHLAPHIGRTYQLQFDESTNSTRITPGYFWNNEAAA